jgi:hypothetical protein
MVSENMHKYHISLWLNSPKTLCKILYQKKQFLTSDVTKVRPLVSEYSSLDTNDHINKGNSHMDLYIPIFEEFTWRKGSEDLHRAIEMYYNIKTSKISGTYELQKHYDLLPAFVMNKPFKVDSKYKFNWHKCWTLPTITVSLNNDRLLSQIPLSPKKLIVKISACIKAQNGLGFEDVGLDGKNQELSLTNGLATFRNLKFRGTSKTHNGSKFNILISFILKDESSNQQHELLECYISPAIFVDARRASRQEKITRVIKYSPQELFR